MTESSSRYRWHQRWALRKLANQGQLGLIQLADYATQYQIIDRQTRDMYKGVLRISSLQARHVMVPRTQMATISLAEPAKDIIQKVVDSAHTRIPVFNGAGDEIAGIIHAKDLLKLFVSDHHVDHQNIKGLLREAIFIPESKKLDSLLRDFKSSHNHLAIVVDEYGAISGIVTIEDILEEIVGEIEDEFDENKQPIVKKKTNEYVVDALTEIPLFNEYFKTHFDEENFDTIGGFITHTLEHLPQKGETLEADGLRFHVTNAQKRRIISLTVSYLDPATMSNPLPHETN